jgi:hypothetical protein
MNQKIKLGLEIVLLLDNGKKKHDSNALWTLRMQRDLRRASVQTIKTSKEW